jgi:predicted lipid-binding transport protein (Tim44 family)
VNVYPIQSQPEGDGAKCPNCGTPVAVDQRYCLVCGQPCSPVRLPFLDVLKAENDQRVAPIAISSPPAAGYMPPLSHDDGAIGRLRRYSGLFGLIAVLLMTGLIGLLVGHWLAPSKAPAASVIKIEGTLPSASAASTTTTPATPSSPSSSSSGKAAASKSSEAQEVKEVKEAESPKAKPKPAVKPSAATLDKLSSSKGKQHQKEIEKLTEGKKPIETGG